MFTEEDELFIKPHNSATKDTKVSDCKWIHPRAVRLVSVKLYPVLTGYIGWYSYGQLSIWRGDTPGLSNADDVTPGVERVAIPT